VVTDHGALREISAAYGPIEDHLHAVATEVDLPDAAIAVCTLRAEEAGPALRAVLDSAAAGRALSEDEARLLFRGLFILGGARDPLAFKPLLRFLRRPEEEIDDLIGDAVTQSLPQIIAGTFDGDAETLLDAIADRAIDEYIRDSLLGAATTLAWDGRIERDRMRRFLEQFHAEKLADDEDYAWIGWLMAISLLGLRELAPLVERAWDERLPERVLDREHFEADLAEAERAPRDPERLRQHNLGYIEDVLEALDWTRGLELFPAEEDDEDAGDWGWLDAAPGEPASNPWRHVGRNDPCPCGSGRKAKKCCLGESDAATET